MAAGKPNAVSYTPDALGMVLELGSHTDVGKVRSQNEDFLGSTLPQDLETLSTKGYFIIVADGMGGHAAGDVASRTAVGRALEVYYNETHDPDPARNLETAVKAANKAVHEAGKALGGHAKMGTTFVAIVLRGREAWIANVGDSRCYMIRDGQMQQVTKDHSWVAMQVAMGELTEEEAEQSEEKNILVRCIGEHPDVVVDIDHIDLQARDCFLLCSDGLHGMVNKHEIRLRVMQMTTRCAAESLVDLANRNGGVDNISVHIVRVHKVGINPPPVPVNGSAAVAV
ncbi:MAG: Stp1/IreP family PP2C-type Ser/Thr phosphatase [Candidatus Xenobia bacterium]